MLHILILLFHFNFGWEISGTVEKLPASDTLTWQPSTKLTWEDFLGEAPARNSYAAFTYTMISMEYSATITNGKVKPTFEIYSAFNRRKSWVKKEKEARTAEILAHEQAHFDIAEITARKLRKALLGASFSKDSLEPKINRLYQETIQAGDLMQALYDQESNHGLNKTQQQKWLAAVKQELLDLKIYER